ncbi:unnamed protein product [Protopolystoma xenopodis]|uniref:Uncharacterized protein n=1 Tax=Protopolystoma xenopodis TaxID=117903 RepID=A0A3S5A595_9PLAT|nr:unnamed protein product [Protopolystoma xenopodis]
MISLDNATLFNKSYLILLFYEHVISASQQSVIDTRLKARVTDDLRSGLIERLEELMKTFREMAQEHGRVKLILDTERSSTAEVESRLRNRLSDLQAMTDDEASTRASIMNSLLLDISDLEEANKGAQIKRMEMLSTAGDLEKKASVKENQVNGLRDKMKELKSLVEEKETLIEKTNADWKLEKADATQNLLKLTESLEFARKEQLQMIQTRCECDRRNEKLTAELVQLEKEVVAAGQANCKAKQKVERLEYASLQLYNLYPFMMGYPVQTDCHKSLQKVGCFRDNMVLLVIVLIVII